MKLHMMIECKSDINGFDGQVHILDNEDKELPNILDIMYMGYTMLHATKLIYGRMAQHIASENVEYPDPTIVLTADILYDLMNSTMTRLQDIGAVNCSCDELDDEKEEKIDEGSNQSFIKFNNNWNPTQLN